MGEVIVVTSGKGGVGKTTTVANIGTGLAMLNKKTVVVDTDIGLRNLDVILGLENRIVYNLVDVINGSCRMKQALIKDRRYPDLFLLPSAQTKDKSAVSPEQMIKLTDELREEFDYVLLDCRSRYYWYHWRHSQSEWYLHLPDYKCISEYHLLSGMHFPKRIHLQFALQ